MRITGCDLHARLQTQVLSFVYDARPVAAEYFDDSVVRDVSTNHEKETVLGNGVRSAPRASQRSGADVASTSTRSSGLESVTTGRSPAGHGLPSCPTSRWLMRT
jgi:hypothetical protein